MSRIRFFLSVAVISTAAGAGAGIFAPAAAVPPAETGNLYARPGGTPTVICYCGGTECAPCLGGGTAEPEQPNQD